MASSLYVGDLDPTVTAEQLLHLFSQVGSVSSVRVCTDIDMTRSLGYGFVNFSDPQDAARAMTVLNFTLLNNKPIRIMYSYHDPSRLNSCTGNIFIKNLEKSIDNRALYDTFSFFGNVVSCKVACDSSGESKGYGFVQFDNDESAQAAIDKLNGMLMNDKQVFICRCIPRNERENTSKFCNVIVKNLFESTTEEDLKNIFGEYGHITRTVVMRHGDGKSKGFGFVNFENGDDAIRAVEALNGKKFDERVWYVEKALEKSEREQELRSKFEQIPKKDADNAQAQFSQMRPMALPSSAYTWTPIYPSDASYGQVPATIHPQVGFGYPQQQVGQVQWIWSGGGPTPISEVQALGSAFSNVSLVDQRETLHHYYPPALNPAESPAPETSRDSFQEESLALALANASPEEQRERARERIK
ncbi:PREDICTED: polyadenylate-binding protein 2-like isoform X2 [Tarenaya hassleriana]|uniref:polyadenylate-binding protein 2-like isoform X2 n=1 Tax=Tarenaya hassleriana TaxID=28532 RepID=UPI00053C7140|nr:PREDICTED: polyadenylate-binding protein 2-like isoform X2 [Tarenaya hassleriana]